MPSTGSLRAHVSICTGSFSPRNDVAAGGCGKAQSGDAQGTGRPGHGQSETPGGGFLVTAGVSPSVSFSLSPASLLASYTAKGSDYWEAVTATICQSSFGVSCVRTSPRQRSLTKSKQVNGRDTHRRRNAIKKKNQKTQRDPSGLSHP